MEKHRKSSKAVLFSAITSPLFLLVQSVTGGKVTVNKTSENLQKPGICTRVLGFFIKVFAAIRSEFTAGSFCKTEPKTEYEILYNKSLTQLRHAAVLLIVALGLFIIFLISCYQFLEVNGDIVIATNRHNIFM